MFNFSGSIYSQTLRMSTGLSVCLPTGYDPEANGPIPVLYLLHGLTGNHACWGRHTDIDAYAEREGVAVIMPEVQRSFYSDMHYGLDYFSYVAVELPKLCKKLFNISSEREKTFIAGASMGGYGAGKIALTYPENYGGAGLFSGAVDINYRYPKLMGDFLSENELVAISDGRVLPENDLFLLADNLKAANRPLPIIYQTCGLSDFLLPDNHNFKKHMEKLELPFIYEEWEGDHEWKFWDKSIENALKVFLGRDRG